MSFQSPGLRGLLFAASFVPLFATGGSLETLPFALSGGTPSVDLRLRYENVDQRNALNNAYATTLRARIGYGTGKWNDFDIYGDFEGISALFNQDYNSTANGKTNQSVVADPQDTRLNQAFVRYTGLPGTMLWAGRRRLNLDNQRFIGSVAWRQAEQTYDSYGFVSSWLDPKSTVSYTYVSNVNTVNFTDLALRGHLVNLNYKFAPALSLTGYAYLLNFKKESAAKRDTATLGARALGQLPVGGGVSFGYTAEYARQLSYGQSPTDVGATYWFIEPSISWKMLNARAGYEILGANAGGTYGFQTPLATLHIFQGFADLFLSTPGTGIRDLYVLGGAKVEQVTLSATYHNFYNDDSGRKYGYEVDAIASRPLARNLSALVKYASYHHDSFGADTKKLWVQLDYAF